MADMLTVRGTVQRSKAEGIPISEYALRTWIKQGLIPVRYAGSKVLIFWPNVRNFITCANGGDNSITMQPPRRCS